jgi:hypothetical protein
MAMSGWRATGLLVTCALAVVAAGCASTSSQMDEGTLGRIAEQQAAAREIKDLKPVLDEENQREAGEIEKELGSLRKGKVPDGATIETEVNRLERDLLRIEEELRFACYRKLKPSLEDAESALEEARARAGASCKEDDLGLQRVINDLRVEGELGFEDLSTRKPCHEAVKRREDFAAQLVGMEFENVCDEVKTAAASECVGEPYSEDEARKVMKKQGAELEKMKGDAALRLQQLMADLAQLESPDGPPLSPALDQVLGKLACAERWIRLLGDGDLAQRVDILKRDARQVPAVRGFLASSHQFTSMVIAGASQQELDLKFADLEDQFQAFESPSPGVQRAMEEAGQAKQDRLWASQQARVESVRMSARQALAVCDETAAKAAFDELDTMDPDGAGALRREWREQCGLDVSGLVARLERGESACREALRLDRTNGPECVEYVQTVAEVEAMGDEVVFRVSELRRFDMDVQRTEFLRNIIAGDRALRSCDWRAASRAYEGAQATGGSSVDATRWARVSVCRARSAVDAGQWDEAWEFYQQARSTLGAEIDGEMADAALTAALASEGDMALAWYQWAGKHRDFATWPNEALDGVCAAGAIWPDHAEMVWAAALARCDKPPVPPLETLAAAALAAKVLDRNDEYQALARRVWPSDGSEVAIHVHLLDVYLQLMDLTASAIDDLQTDASSSGFGSGAGSIRRAVEDLVRSVGQAPFVASAALPAEGLGTGGGLDGLVAEAESRRLVFSADRALVAASTETRLGPFTMVFRSLTVDRAHLENAVATAVGEALALATVVRAEAISARATLTVGERKQQLEDAIVDVRHTMRGRLAYMGLFELGGRLEVPRRAGEFFIHSELRQGPTPVFQDEISRRAQLTEAVLRQEYDHAGISLVDVAVPVRRGMNKVGVLRVGIRQRTSE